jgi:DNA-binding response OmpR family regulator
MRVLIVEDEIPMATALRRGLRDVGMLADVAVRGEDALWMAGSTDYDVLVLDVMLPQSDGFETCRRLRADGVRTPVIMLTARDAVDDRVTGLNTGADDYLSKPFSFAELVARLQALARRSGSARATVLRRGDVELDPARRTAARGGRDLGLGPKEFGVLEVLLAADGAVVSAEELLARVWDENADPFTNAVRMVVMTLRRKLGDPPVVETVPGAGYRV